MAKYFNENFPKLANFSQVLRASLAKGTLQGGRMVRDDISQY